MCKQYNDDEFKARLIISMGLENAPMKYCAIPCLVIKFPTPVFFKDDKIRSIQLSGNYKKMLGKPIPELLGKTISAEYGRSR